MTGKMSWPFAAAVAVLLGCISAAYGQDGIGCSAPAQEPSIAGTYTDNFGGPHSISKNFWTSGSLVFVTCEINETKRHVVAQNHARNQFNPGKYSRFEWVNAKNRLWYCQTVFDAPTLQDATSAPPADPTNPEAGGCGGQFAWSTLIRILP